MNPKPDLHADLPLTEATFFVLLSMAPCPKHGYAILKDVESLSQARVTLSTGTLYGAIKRLLAQQWIEPVDLPEQTNANGQQTKRPRKAYALTDLGRRMLNAEINRLQALVEVAQLQLA